MDTYFERLFTFHATGSESGDGEGRSWPVNTLRPEDMAGAGFYFTGNETQTPDSVTCFSCKMQAWQWKRKDDPFDEHSSGSPNCDYVTIYDSAPADTQAQNAVHHDTSKQPVEIAITAGSTKFTIQVTDVGPRGTKRLRVD
ncbi:baculoviral iap repeat-containing protein 3 [Colletotrichum kahawae]|uniref:Baculoviral iap repeat-containing protein 3 n=1 Tax=Colletotrichum kahawae TaxID=34407 RepID=A0AAE0D1R9_COLKA|nr:baculoviral iap repeat-containing protein 3 [Colletotrichum kahawae]